MASITRQVERFFQRGQAYVARKKERAGVAPLERTAEDGQTGEAGAIGQSGEVKVVNNRDWRKDVSLIDFL